MLNNFVILGGKGKNSRAAINTTTDNLENTNSTRIESINSNQPVMQFTQQSPSSESEGPLFNYLRRQQSLQMAAFNIIAKHMDTDNTK